MKIDSGMSYLFWECKYLRLAFSMCFGLAILHHMMQEDDISIPYKHVLTEEPTYSSKIPL